MDPISALSIAPNEANLPHNLSYIAVSNKEIVTVFDLHIDLNGTPHPNPSDGQDPFVAKSHSIELPKDSHIVGKAERSWVSLLW